MAFNLSVSLLLIQIHTVCYDFKDILYIYDKDANLLLPYQVTFNKTAFINLGNRIFLFVLGLV